MLAVETVLDVETMDLRAATELLQSMPPDQAHELRNVKHLHGLLAGLKHGEYVIHGDAGDYLGVLNDGASIRVKGNVGKYVGDNMTRGLIVVEGNADYGAGLYPYGGVLVVRGDAGDFTATMNKGATIIVAGNVGDECGTYHLAGDFIVAGNAGLNFGNYLIRGTLYLGGEMRSQGHNTLQEPLTEADTLKLMHYFEQYDIDAHPRRFKKFIAKSQKPFYE